MDTRTTATVTLAEGFEPVTPEVWGNTLVVMVPHLVLTITAADALTSWLRAWSVGRVYAARLWGGADSASTVAPADAPNRVTAALRLASPVDAPRVRAVSAAAADGRAHLVLTVDRVRFVLAHGAAWNVAWTTWAAAYETGARLWTLPALESLGGASAMRWMRAQQTSARLGL